MGIVMDQKLIDIIEHYVSEAYEIGFAHGSNTYRTMKGKQPMRVDDGWGECSDKIIELVDKLHHPGEK